jgi:hypothetical protein
VPAAHDRVETSDRANPLELVPLVLSDLLIVSIREISARVAPGRRYLRGTKPTRRAQATPAMHDMPTAPLAT